MSIPGFEHIPNLTTRAFKQYNNFMMLIEFIHFSENPVKSKVLEKTLKLSGPEIRALRALAWAKGDPILAGGSGYFWATHSTQVKQCKDSITARRNALITAENDLKTMMFKFLDAEKLDLFR